MKKVLVIGLWITALINISCAYQAYYSKKKMDEWLEISEKDPILAGLVYNL